MAGLSAASAQGTAPPKASGKEYTLAKTSSFDAPPADARNPFWPIGWTPGPVVTAAAAAPVYTVKAEDFVLTTTSVDYPPLAIINRRSYSVGESIPVAGGADMVKVKAIQDGVVLLDHHGRGNSHRVQRGPLGEEVVAAVCSEARAPSCRRLAERGSIRM